MITFFGYKTNSQALALWGLYDILAAFAVIQALINTREINT